jgi:hypothetical protein
MGISTLLLLQTYLSTSRQGREVPKENANKLKLLVFPVGNVTQDVGMNVLAISVLRMGPRLFVLMNREREKVPLISTVYMILPY